jgi:TctA family transporter
MERSLRQTLIISRGNLSGLWESSLCVIMWAIILIAVILPFVTSAAKRKTKPPAE